MKLHRIAVACLALCLVGSAVPFADAGEIPPIVANAEEEAPTSGTCGENVNWNFDKETGTLTISGTGTVLPSLWEGHDEMRGLVKRLIIENGITSIGDGAFAGCVNLAEVLLPEGMSGIGNGVFSSCIGLSSIKIPDSVTDIGSGAFYSCTALQEVKLSRSLAYIQDGLFSSCSSLRAIEIPSSVTRIGNGSFYQCSQLTSIEIPNSVGSLGTGVFTDCGALASVTLSSTITSIPSGTFGGCVSLTSIRIPEQVISIGSAAFSGCTGLTDVYYEGTARQWSSVTIQNQNECLTGAVIHFSDSGENEVLGDINYDGEITVSDVIEVSRRLSRRRAVPKNCDMNGDNIVNVIDLALLKKALLNK